MTTNTSAEALEESIFWLKAKYRRHGEIEDRIAAEQLEYFQAEKRRSPPRRTPMADTMTLEQVRDWLNNRAISNTPSSDISDESLGELAAAIDAAIKQREQDANNPLKWWIFDKLAEALRDATYVAGMLDAICETDGTVDHMQARDAAFRVRDALQAHTAEVAHAQAQSGEWVMVPREPTQAMTDAACKIKLDRLGAFRTEYGSSIGIVAAVQEEWAAMIAAAPRKRHDTINLLEDSTAQPPAAGVTDESVLVPIKDESWPPLRVIRAMLDCQEADPADGSESEAYYGLRAAMKEWQAALAAQESPNE